MSRIAIWLRRYFWFCPWEGLLTIIQIPGYPFWLWIFGDVFCGEKDVLDQYSRLIDLTVHSMSCGR